MSPVRSPTPSSAALQEKTAPNSIFVAFGTDTVGNSTASTTHTGTTHTTHTSTETPETMDIKSEPEIIYNEYAEGKKRTWRKKVQDTKLKV